MSIWIPYTQFNETTQRRLIRDLTIPRTSRRPPMAGKPVLPEGESLYAFDVEGGDIRIPYHYARNTLGVVPNGDRYPKLSEKHVSTMTGKLRPGQERAIGIIIPELRQTGVSRAIMAPGTGKTIVGAHTTATLGYPTIVVVPIKKLVAQWRKTYEMVVPTASVWMVGVDKNIPTDRPDVIISLDTQIKNIPVEWRKMYGLLVVDEAHMFATPTRIKALLSIRPLHILIETATPVRLDGLHLAIEAVGGKAGAVIDSVSPYKMRVVEMSYVHPEEVYTSRGVNYGALCDSISADESYNRTIVGIVKANPSNKFIILTLRVSHGETLKNMLTEADVTCDTLTGCKNRYTDSRVLVGTFSKIGTGFDEANACEDFGGVKSDSLIICQSIASPPNFEQYRGRVMRSENPVVYWLNTGNRVIRSHLTKMKKEVVSSGGVIENVKGEDYLRGL